MAKRAATVLRSDKVLEIHDRHATGDRSRSGLARSATGAEGWRAAARLRIGIVQRLLQELHEAGGWIFLSVGEPTESQSTYQRLELSGGRVLAGLLSTLRVPADEPQDQQQTPRDRLQQRGSTRGVYTNDIEAAQ